MDYVVQVMSILIQFCSGHDQPLIYPNDCYTFSMYSFMHIYIYHLIYSIKL